MIASLPRAAPRVVASAVRDIDWVLRELAALQHRLIPVLAEAAFTLVQERAWFDFGYARAADFARERLGRTGRWLHDHAALGERFRCFPALARAVTGEDGGPPLGRVAALLVGRVATAADVELWIERARSTPVRRLREIIRMPMDLMDKGMVVSTKMPGPVRVAFGEALALHRAAWRRAARKGTTRSRCFPAVAFVRGYGAALRGGSR